jgi:acyl-CoA dehydrogenase
MSLFDISERAQRYQSDLLEFMDSHVYPAAAVYDEQMREAGAIASQELRKYRDG